MRPVKVFLNLILSATLILPLSLMAVPKTESEKGVAVDARAFRVEFDNIIYSIETIPQVTEEFNRWFQMAGANGISPSVSKIIMERMVAAIDLMSVIYADTSLPKEQRRKMLEALYAAIGNVILQIAYNEKEDYAVSMFRESFLGSPVSKATLVEVRRDFMRIFNIKEMIFPSKIKSVNYQRVQADASPTEQEQIKIANEQEMVSQAEDRLNRDRMSIEVLVHLQKFARDVVPVLPEGQGTREFTKEVFGQEDVQHVKQDERSLPNSLILQKETNIKAKRNAIAVYFGLAFASVVFLPYIDWVGTLEIITSGTRSDNSGLLSIASYATLWLLMGIRKSKTLDSFSAGAEQIVTEAKYLKALMQNPNLIADSENAKIQEKRMSFMRKVITTIGEKCSLLLGGKGSGVEK